MPEWLIGLIFTILGFFLAMLWDIFKSRQESKQRDKAVLLTGREELSANLDLLKENHRMLEHEIESDGFLVTPLNLLQIGFWDLVKVNLPQKLVEREDVLVKVREASLIAVHVNEVIHARENHRIHNESMSNFRPRLKMYDEILLKAGERLSGKLDELKPLL